MSLGLNRGLRSKKCKYSLGLDGPLIFGNSLICILIGFISGYDIYIYICKNTWTPQLPFNVPQIPTIQGHKDSIEGRLGGSWGIRVWKEFRD